jgi:MFS family permease
MLRVPASGQFRRLWAGQGVSLVGTQFTLLGLPLTAAVLLNATPTQMGIMVAAEMLPILLLGLLVGVWVDRVRRRPLLIGADIARAILIGSVPIAALLGVLSMEQLYAVALGMGLLTLCFDTAAPVFLPFVAEESQLAEAYSALSFNESAAETAGPGLAGLVIQGVSAPVALVVDAISYLVSAAVVLSIRADEPRPHANGKRAASVLSDVREGLHIVFAEPTLRMAAILIGSAGMFVEMRNVLLVLFAVRELELSAAVLGIVMAVGSVGGMLGAAFTPRVIDRFGMRRTFIATALLIPVTLLVTPLAFGGPWLAAAVLTVGQLSFQVVLVTSNISVRMLRQAHSPKGLLGRVTASMRTITRGTLPLGAVVGALLAEHLDIRTALFVSAVAALAACVIALPRPSFGGRWGYTFREAPWPFGTWPRLFSRAGRASG